MKKLLNVIINNSSSNKKSKFDIVAFNIPWIGQLTKLNCLLPLNNFVKDVGINLNDFHYSGVRSSSFNKKLYGIPIEAIPDLLFYRTDIFQKYAGNCFN